MEMLEAEWAKVETIISKIQTTIKIFLILEMCVNIVDKLSKSNKSVGNLTLLI